MLLTAPGEPFAGDRAGEPLGGPVFAVQRDLCKTAGYACGAARRDAARACGQAVSGVPVESGSGDACRASVILARAQRRDVRPNSWASLRSDSRLPAFTLSPHPATPPPFPAPPPPPPPPPRPPP